MGDCINSQAKCNQNALGERAWVKIKHECALWQNTEKYKGYASEWTVKNVSVAFRGPVLLDWSWLLNTPVTDCTWLASSHSLIHAQIQRFKQHLYYIHSMQYLKFFSALKQKPPEVFCFHADKCDTATRQKQTKTTGVFLPSSGQNPS